MKVWLIRLSMPAKLVDNLGARFSKAALLSGRAHPGHGPVRPHEQARPLAGEASQVGRRRLTHDRAKRAAEGTEAVEPDVEADGGNRAPRLAQELHGALDPTALQVAMRRLAERGPELAAEMSSGDVRDARERSHVQRLC